MSEITETPTPTPAPQPQQTQSTGTMPTPAQMVANILSLYPSTEGVQFCGGKNFDAQAPLSEMIFLKKSEYGERDVFRLGAFGYTPGDIMFVHCDGIWSSANGMAGRGFHKLGASCGMPIHYLPTGTYNLKASATDYNGRIFGTDTIIVIITD